MRPIPLLHAVLLAGLVLGAALAWPSLPDRVAAHIVALVVTLLLCLVPFGLWRAAHGHPTPWLTVVVVVLSVGMVPVVLGLGLPRIQEELDRQFEAAGPDRRMYRPRRA